MSFTRTLVAAGTVGAGIGFGAALVGCGGGGPRVGVNLTDAVFVEDVATLELEVFNRGGSSLTLKEIDYTLATGDLVLADSVFRLSRALPANSTVNVTLPILLTGGGPSADADSVTLGGTLNFEQATGEGIEQTSKPFAADGAIRR